MSDLDAAQQLRRQLRQDHRLLWRMRLARAALLWERVWPAAWQPPLQALLDQPSIPLDRAAAGLWAAHRQRMEAAIRRLRVGWPVAGLARHDPWGLRSVLAILLVLAVVDAGADWRERAVRALT